MDSGGPRVTCATSTVRGSTSRSPSVRVGTGGLGRLPPSPRTLDLPALSPCEGELWGDSVGLEGLGDELSSDYLSQAEAIATQGRGLTPTRVLASREGRPSSPRYSPDGASILYTHSSAHEGASVRRVQRDNSRDERVSRGAAASLDGRERVLLSSLKRTNRYALHRDLYELNLETGERRRLSRGGRLSDVALRPSGTWAVAVRPQRDRASWFDSTSRRGTTRRGSPNGHR